jgi:hypothetical protein
MRRYENIPIVLIANKWDSQIRVAIHIIPPFYHIYFTPLYSPGMVIGTDQTKYDSVSSKEESCFNWHM